MFTKLVLSAVLLGLTHAALVDLNATQSDGVKILKKQTFEYVLFALFIPCNAALTC